VRIVSTLLILVTHQNLHVTKIEICCSVSLYADNEQYLNCSSKPFDCAGIQNLSYLFWGSNRPNYCSHSYFELNCSGDAPLIKITNLNYKILDVNNVSRTLMIAREDYWNTVCLATFINTTINFTFFAYNSGTTNLALYYDCLGYSSSSQLLDTALFDCSINGTAATNHYSNSTNEYTIANLWQTCEYNVKVPVLQSAAEAASNSIVAAMFQAIDGGFMLGWDANNSLCM
jgi:hypothetical protein